MREPKGFPTPLPFHVMLLYNTYVQNICSSLRSLMRGTDWSANADLSPSVARCIGFNHMANLFFFILYKKENLPLSLFLPLKHNVERRGYGGTFRFPQVERKGCGETFRFPLFFGLFPFFTF